MSSKPSFVTAKLGIFLRFRVRARALLLFVLIRTVSAILDNSAVSSAHVETIIGPYIKFQQESKLKLVFQL